MDVETSQECGNNEWTEKCQYHNEGSQSRTAAGMGNKQSGRALKEGRAVC